MQELMRLLSVDLDSAKGYVKIAVAFTILGFVASMIKDLF